ncbi:hypothetical protein J7J23_02345 [bacterium]|nr:hypothetical protein [bacterium]
METNFQKIKELVLSSDISPEDQEELLLAFFKTDDAELEPVLKLFLEDKSWIQKISDNLKAKNTAAITGDRNLWKRILQDEETQLRKLEN